MTKRKTFDVQRFKDYINGSLKFNYNDSEKRAFIQMLEYVLEETGNYKGFRYVYTDNERPCLDDPIDGKVYNPNWTKRHELMRHYF